MFIMVVVCVSEIAVRHRAPRSLCCWPIRHGKLHLLSSFGKYILLILIAPWCQWAIMSSNIILIFFNCHRLKKETHIGFTSEVFSKPRDTWVDFLMIPHVTPIPTTQQEWTSELNQPELWSSLKIFQKKTWHIIVEYQKNMQLDNWTIAQKRTWSNIWNLGINIVIPRLLRWQTNEALNCNRSTAIDSTSSNGQNKWALYNIKV